MGLNNIELAEIYTQALDEKLQAGARSSFMEQNADRLIFTGANTCKVPKMTVAGLGNYDRDGGFGTSGFSVSYEDFVMGQDRSVGFQVDAQTVDESNMVATVGNAMNQLLKTQVIPEIDKYRFSKIASLAIEAPAYADESLHVSYGYTPDKATILTNLKTDINNIQDRIGTDTQLVVIMSTKTLNTLELSSEVQRQLEVGQMQGNGDLVVPCKMVDEVPIIEAPSDRLFTKYDYFDGKTAGQEAGGAVKDSSALTINWIIMGLQAPIAVSKTANVRIFDPSTNQKCDAWMVQYRVYHDLFIEDNMMDSVFVNLKEAKPTV